MYLLDIASQCTSQQTLLLSMVNISKGIKVKLGGVWMYYRAGLCPARSAHYERNGGPG